MELTQAVFDREAGRAALDAMQERSEWEPLLSGLDALAPGFPDWIVTALFGGTYQRAGLQHRERQIATIAAMTAMGGVEPQLVSHVKSAVRAGLTREQIVEVFVHLAPYVGVPKALAGLRAVQAALPGTA